MAEQPEIKADEVLRAFAMDFEPGANVLQRYLTQYPEHSIALVDLSSELTREFDDNVPPGAAELDLVASGMARLRERKNTLQSLQAAPAKTFADAIKMLYLPVQIGLAFRERRIVAATLPQRVLSKMAEALQTSSETLLSYLDLPPATPLARARKSLVKPTAPEKMSFERLLQDAGVDEQSILKLLREE